ncbi:ATP-binding cassette domain-containing protein [Saccharibacillus alkalitolerans]|uniref:ATP-binding cassette domain-containing protein n=1 Tax=Saccharibacillus alkalitolerans TaxID=2705290 RepID=A0ABX0F1A5_9BACL|nr:ATP-binding cassette domain-containing protein [Saccharibacillus alkalitolerans]NGZ74671.1 ATP-binding cassette domain-containing protein [Saccharibacillus alkalitolerans]
METIVNPANAAEYELSGVSVNLGGRAVLKNISFKLEPGSWTSLIGRTGAGKSTLARLVKGLVPDYAGGCLIGGSPAPRDRRGRAKIVPEIGFVFQYPEHQIFETTVERELSFALRTGGASAREIDRAVRRMLEMFGLEEDLLGQSPLLLSGGQKRRLAIASVLIAEPKLLILDEPTAALDPLSRRRLLDRLRDWQREEGRAMLFISHRMEDVAEYSDRVLLLREGELLAHEAADELFLRGHEKLELAGLDLPETAELLKLTEELSGHPLTPRSCREADILQAVREAWRTRGGEGGHGK